MRENVPMIEFAGVSKQYGDTPVLKEINIKIEKGEFVTLIGRSGCGKTTFLKLINALQDPDAGKVCVFGEDVALVDQIALRRKIGYVIQNVGLFPHMTVKKNVSYIPGLFKKKPEKTLEPERLLEMVSLEKELLNRYPSEISGGQKQRVGIARALAIMAVDEITRKQLQASISNIHRELGITIIFVTHSIEEAMLLGTKIAIFEDHRIVQYDSPDEVLRHPADEFVAELTGGQGACS